MKTKRDFSYFSRMALEAACILLLNLTAFNSIMKVFNDGRGEYSLCLPFYSHE